MADRHSRYNMSIRLNLPQKDHSDRSFIYLGDELIATSIGLSNNRTPISCRLNCSHHDYKYGLSEQDAITAICAPETKLKQLAFRQIQKHTHYHRQVVKSVFLPNAISQGDYSAMSKFLENLRSNRVNAYVKLNLQESRGHFTKANTLIKPLTKIFTQRLQHAFARIRRQPQKKFTLQELDHISSIDGKDSRHQSVEDSKNSLVSVSYVKIKVSQQEMQKINEQKLQNSKEVSSTKKTNSSRMGVPLLDLNTLINSNTAKQYQFQRTKLGSQTQRTRILQRR